MNHCSISYDNTLLATGGDDSVIRVYTLSKDFKKTDKPAVELKFATKAITCIDINRKNSILVATSKDGFAYMIDLK